MSRDLERRVRDAGEGGLMEAGRELLRRSDRDLPIGDPSEDPNLAVALQESGYVRRIAPNVIEVGYSTPYATKHHEAIHFKHPRGGKSKFLEDNLKAMIPLLENIVAGEVRKVSGRRT